MEKKSLMEKLKRLMEKLKKVNIIDLIAVVIIALVALTVLWKAVDKLLPDDLFSKDPGTVSGSASTSGAPTSSTPAPSTPAPSTPAPSTPAPSTPAPGTSGGSTTPTEKEPEKKEEPPVNVTYTVRAENVAAALYETVQAKLPSQLMASGALQDGWVVGVEKEPVMVLTADGEWVEDPDRVDLLLTVEAKVPRGTVMTTLAGTQEVRIGDPGYDLNTQYLEFIDTTVVNVEWEDWDFGADREKLDPEKLAQKGLMPITFVVRAEDRPAELYENAQAYIPGQLMASGSLQNGYVVGVEKEPVMVLAADGEWVEDPSRVTLLFTVEAYAAKNDVKSALVGTQEIRIGRAKYTLKTECLEFRNTVVVDIAWNDQDNTADKGQ